MRNEVTTSKNENNRDLAAHNSNSGEMRNFLNHFWNMFDFPKSHEMNVMEPKIEVSNKKDSVVVYAEMPGVEENNIDVQISSDGYLTISGEKHKHTEEKCDGGCFSEVYYGTVSRTIPLPWDLNYDQANAEYNDGVLSIDIPKTQIEKQKVKKISVKKNK